MEVPLGANIILNVSIAAESPEEWVEVSQSPRYFRFSVQDNIGFDPDEPCPNDLIIGVLSPIDDCSKNFLDGLSYSQKLWMYNQQSNGTTLWSNIINYSSRNQQGCHEAGNEIIKDAINAIMNEGATLFNPLTFDDQITTSLPPCLENVINDLKTLQNGKFGKSYRPICRSKSSTIKL